MRRSTYPASSASGPIDSPEPGRLRARGSSGRSTPRWSSATRSPRGGFRPRKTYTIRRGIKVQDLGPSSGHQPGSETTPASACSGTLNDRLHRRPIRAKRSGPATLRIRAGGHPMRSGQRQGLPTWKTSPARLRDAYGRNQLRPGLPAGPAAGRTRRAVRRGHPRWAMAAVSAGTRTRTTPTASSSSAAPARPGLVDADGRPRGRGLLDSTLIVWMGEFGRTPKINPNGDATTTQRPGPRCSPVAVLEAARSSARPRRWHHRRRTARHGARLHGHRLSRLGHRPDEAEPLERRPPDPHGRSRLPSRSWRPSHETPDEPCFGSAGSDTDRGLVTVAAGRSCPKPSLHGVRRRDPGRALPGGIPACFRAVSHPCGGRGLPHGLDRIRGPAPSLSRHR